MAPSPLEVGVRAPHSLFGSGPDGIAAFTEKVEASGLDRIWVGDHVSFRGGQGYDGLLQAAVLASLTRRVTIQTAVYLLPLRHPLPVTRQVASVAEIAPGRFVFGVGVGGDDPHETSNCGIDHAGRGRRMDESLSLVRRLLSGEAVDHAGPTFPLSDALIRPVPAEPVPVVVGGGSPAALRRAGRLSEGWLALFVDPERFVRGVRSVVEEGVHSGRSGISWQHGLLAWCGFGSTREQARSAVAPAVEGLYQMPFERFERYVPHGRAEDVAAALRPFADGGASHILLSPWAADEEEAIGGAAEVRQLLRT